MRTTLKTVFAYLVFVAWGFSVTMLWTLFPGELASDPKWTQILHLSTRLIVAMYGGFYILRQFGCGPLTDEALAKSRQNRWFGSRRRR
jgi:hypothetical protein